MSVDCRDSLGNGIPPAPWDALCVAAVNLDKAVLELLVSSQAACAASIALDLCLEQLVDGGHDWIRRETRVDDLHQEDLARIGFMVSLLVQAGADFNAMGAPRCNRRRVQPVSVVRRRTSNQFIH